MATNPYEFRSEDPSERQRYNQWERDQAIIAATPAGTMPQTSSYDYKTDPAFLSQLYGAAGLIAPSTASQWGMGGAHGSAIGLQDYYNQPAAQVQPDDPQDYQFSENPTERAMWRDMVKAANPTVAPNQVSPEQQAAIAAFQAKYPGYVQLSPEQVQYQNGQIGLKSAGANAGQYVENPGAVQYDPQFGYITTAGNDAVAGQHTGGWNNFTPLLIAAAAAGGAYLTGAEGAAGAAGGGAADAAWGVNAANTANAGGTMTGAFGGLGSGTVAGGTEMGLAGGLGGAGSAGGTLGALGGGAGGLTSALDGVYGAVGAGFDPLALSLPTIPSAGGFNPANYVKNGLPGGAPPPAIPGAGNGVGLTEAALKTLGQGAGGSALSRLLDGTATTADYTSLLGGLGSAGLGFLGAGQQADAYSDVADKYLALGAPSRARLEASYAPGFSMADQPDFQNALDIGAQAAARATSARAGNPVDNPGAYADMQKYITGSLALPQLNTYRSQLGTFGQLGTNTAGAADTGAASQTSGQFNALGYGLDQITKPDNQNNQLMKLLLNSGRSF